VPFKELFVASWRKINFAFSFCSKVREPFMGGIAFIAYDEKRV
jgi:hypothetical protein